MPEFNSLAFWQERIALYEAYVAEHGNHALGASSPGLWFQVVGRVRRQPVFSIWFFHRRAPLAWNDSSDIWAFLWRANDPSAFNGISTYTYRATWGKAPDAFDQGYATAEEALGKLEGK